MRLKFLFQCLLATGLLFGSQSLAEPTKSICALSDDDLMSRFLISLGVMSWTRVPEFPPLARWNRREAGIGVFLDSSARRPADSLERNFALINAIGILGLAPSFRIAIGFQSTRADIELVFVNRATKAHVFRKLPIGTLVSARTDRCRVYLDVAGSGGQIRSISKSYILVDDEVSNSDLLMCVADALVRALGLIGWPHERYSSASEKYEEAFLEARIFLSVLYEIPESSNLSLMRKRLIDAKSAACR